jgi:hypothetical protein
MKGVRHFMREFTATAVREHLRSQVEDRDGPPQLTKKEVELVRYVQGVDWDEFPAERSRA